MIARFWQALLAAFFLPSLEELLNAARRHGSVLLQDEAGAGWYCAIRPNTEERVNGERRRINEWSGRKALARDAVQEAIDEATANPKTSFNEVPNAPMLGGREFDE